MVKMMEGEETRGKRFGVLVCAEESEYMKEKHGGLFGVFVKFLSGEGENWSVFNVAKNEFPNDMELESYDGFVITGSCFDAHSNEVWIFNLLSLIKKLDSLKIRVLGVCFGHQILCRSLGGKIGRAASGWDVGIRTVHIKPSSKKISSNFKIPSKLNVIKCHQDEVLELPAQVEVMAGSNKTSVEMFRYGDHMVGIQGHPEYTRDIVNHFIDRLLHHNIFTVKHANELRSQLMESCDPDREAWRKFCVNFLKGRL